MINGCNSAELMPAMKFTALRSWAPEVHRMIVSFLRVNGFNDLWQLDQQKENVWF